MDPKERERSRLLYFFIGPEGVVLGLDDFDDPGGATNKRARFGETYYCTACLLELHYWPDALVHIEPEQPFTEEEPHIPTGGRFKHAGKWR